MYEDWNLRSDVTDRLRLRGWEPDEELPELMWRKDGVVWGIANPSGDSGVDSADKEWSLAFDSGVPAHVIVASCAAVVAGPPSSEGLTYQVVGGWGVDGARDHEDALNNVRRSLAAYPYCRARADQRVTQTWDDGSEAYGPWEEVS